jgi:hypothetical protein
VVKNGEILVSVFRAVRISIVRIATACARRADKIGYAVCRQWVMVVGELAFVGPSSRQFSVPDMPHTAKPCFSLRDLTPVLAQAAGQAVSITRRF